MPDKLTDNEIIKALKYCVFDLNCNHCPYYYNGQIHCGDINADILDLINRLQAKVEKCDRFEKVADATIETLQAENERLKGKVEELSDVLSDTIRIRYAEAKVEAYKEFAEKVIKLIKAKAFNVQLMRSLYTSQSAKSLERVAEDINNLLKELVGDSDV